MQQNETKKVKILVVEDDTPIREMYILKLQAQGFEVDGAEDGEVGLKKCEDFKPDLILLDLMMPQMNGDEMLRRVRDQEWGKDILVIVLTNISQDEAPMDMRMLRVERYIVKAYYTPTQVLEMVLETLTRYQKIPPASALPADQPKPAA